MGIIACWEHYFCFIGTWILEAKSLDDVSDPAMLDLMRWHGAEEVEHRTVAFDAYRALAGEGFGSYIGRQAAMVVAFPVMIGFLLEAASWYFSEADFKPTREAFSHPDIAWAASRYYRSLFSFHRQASRQGGSLLISSLNIPTLALAGLDDGCMNIRLHERLAHQAGFSTTVKAVYLAHCGHFLHAENPHAVASELLAHFSQHHISQH